MTEPQPGTAMLLSVLNHTRSDLARADLTALAGPALLAAFAQAITQIGGIPPIVLPFLMTAAAAGAGVIAAACVVIWPRRINITPTTPGSWLHARTVASTAALLAAYGAATVEEINAEQLLELADVAHRKWTAVRWMLPPLGAAVAVLLAALVVGLSHG